MSRESCEAAAVGRRVSGGPSVDVKLLCFFGGNGGGESEGSFGRRSGSAGGGSIGGGRLREESWLLPSAYSPLLE